MSLILRSAICKNVCRSVVLKPSYVVRQSSSLSRPLRSVWSRVVNVSTRRMLSAGAHDHSKVWVLEKAVSVGLLGVIPAAFVFPNQMLDYALALSLVIHVHWGFEAMVVDYIRPALFGPVIPKVALGGLYLLSVLALAGLFYLNYSDVGLSTAVRMFAKA